MLPASAVASWTAEVAVEDGRQDSVAVGAAVGAAVGLQDVAVQPEVD